MTTAILERRAYLRSVRALSLSIQDCTEPSILPPLLSHLRTSDIGPGGLRFKVFEPIPFSTNDVVAVRISIPDALCRDTSGMTASVLRPSVTGLGTVLRVERVFVQGVAGWSVAIRFDGPLGIDDPVGLTGAATVP